MPNFRYVPEYEKLCNWFSVLVQAWENDRYPEGYLPDAPDLREQVQAVFSGRKLFDFVVDGGLLDENAWLPVSNPAGIFELYRREDVDRLDASLDAERLHYVGTDMFTYYRRDDIDALDARLYEKYLAYTMSICENPHLVGASNHTLDILRRR